MYGESRAQGGVGWDLVVLTEAAFKKTFGNELISDTLCYNMALSHREWELPNSRNWLAEIDIDRGLYE